MSERKKPAETRATIDLSAIRHLLTLTPEERIRLAAEEVRNMQMFELEVEKSRKR